MSGSVFIPKNSEILSATSPVPQWLKGGNGEEPSKVQNDIYKLVGQAGGAKKSKKGSKKASKKASKKGSKKASKKLLEEIMEGGAYKKSKKSSKKASKKGSKKSSKKLLEGGAKKKASKKASKKGSKKSKKFTEEPLLDGGAKKSSKKGSKKSSKKMARELPPAIVYGNKFKEAVQKDMNLKGGPLLMVFSYSIWNEFKGKNASASPEELYNGAMKLYNDYKKQGKLESMYKQAEKDFEAKKAAKKASKAGEQ